MSCPTPETDRCSARASSTVCTTARPTRPSSVSTRVEAVMAESTVSVNRAAVLTLWAAVVAERLGFEAGEALSLGRAAAGLNA